MISMFLPASAGEEFLTGTAVSDTEMLPEETPGREAYLTENEEVPAFDAGTVLSDVLSEEELKEVLQMPDAYFSAQPIDEEVFSRIDGRTYPEDCSVSLDELRYLRVLHYNFDHEVQAGELIVHADLADIFLEIFRALFDEEYEIYSMYLPEEFWAGDVQATDTASMEANNTSAFSYRRIASSGNLSNHAEGRAIDINPLQNPYVEKNQDGSLSCEPADAVSYLDRSSGLEHVITCDDFCCQLFLDYGFTWGGSWNSPVDYQHFERKW